jgi:hypothetical protein
MGTCAQASISYIDPYSQRSADGDVSFIDRSASPRSAGVSLTVVKQMEANGARYLSLSIRLLLYLCCVLPSCANASIDLRTFCGCSCTVRTE